MAISKKGDLWRPTWCSFFLNLFVSFFMFLRFSLIVRRLETRLMLPLITFVPDFAFLCRPCSAGLAAAKQLADICRVVWLCHGARNENQSWFTEIFLFVFLTLSKPFLLAIMHLGFQSNFLDSSCGPYPAWLTSTVMPTLHDTCQFSQKPSKTASTAQLTSFSLVDQGHRVALWLVAQTCLKYTFTYFCTHAC